MQPQFLWRPLQSWQRIIPNDQISQLEKQPLLRMNSYLSFQCLNAHTYGARQRLVPSKPFATLIYEQVPKSASFRHFCIRLCVMRIFSGFKSRCICMPLSWQAVSAYRIDNKYKTQSSGLLFAIPSFYISSFRLQESHHSIDMQQQRGDSQISRQATTQGSGYILNEQQAFISSHAFSSNSGLSLAQVILSILITKLTSY